MATRRPLVIIDGVVQEIAVADDLPADCIPGGGGGGGADINGMAFTDADTSTVTSGLVNYNEADRVYIFPDASGTVALVSDLANLEGNSNRNAHDGYVGLSGYAVSFKNSSGAHTSYINNFNTTSRNYTFPDKSGVIATMGDIPIAPVMGHHYITIGVTEDQSNHTGEVVLAPEQGMTGLSFLMVQLTETPENGDDEIRECTLFATSGNNKFTYYLSSDGPIFGQFLITYCFYPTPQN